MFNAIPHNLTSARQLASPVVAVVLMLATVLLGISGCGYFTTGTHPADVRSIAVKIFDNKTPYQRLELDLAEALNKEIELRTPYKLTATSSADTILQGTIVAAKQSRLSRRRGAGVPQEMELRVQIDFEWKDLHSGDILRQRSGFEKVGRYIPSRPISERLDLAQHDVARQLAQAIVSVMRDDW